MKNVPKAAPKAALRTALSAALISAFLWGCASQTTPEASKAGVEERTPGARAAEPVATPPVAPPPPVTTRTIEAPPVNVAGVLKDPNNILSRRSVLFEYDSDAIKDEFRPMLQAHAKYLADTRDSKLLIQGNCDERGSREYNIALGQRRADAVKRLMVLLGAPEAKIETVSLGEEKPRCTESTEECWAQNRRGDLLHAGEF